MHGERWEPASSDPSVDNELVAGGKAYFCDYHGPGGLIEKASEELNKRLAGTHYGPARYRLKDREGESIDIVETDTCVCAMLI